MDFDEWRAAYVRAVATIPPTRKGETMDEYAAQTMLQESGRTIDTLRIQLANETELADKMHLALQALMKDYVIGELDPRTDELISTAMGDYRQARLDWMK